MGLVSELSRCALDFLADERCHACVDRVRDAPGAEFAPLAVPVEVAAIAGIRLFTRVLCAGCARRVLPWHRSLVLRSHPPGFAPALRMHAAFITDDRLLALIHLLKFDGRERIAPWLAHAMVSVLPAPARTESAHAPILVPVPLDGGARARRGFNQAESIGRALAAHWRMPVEPRALSKLRRTPPQSELDRAQRLRNLDGAFLADVALVRGRRILLVDDLVTTGATAHACAHALRVAGAGEVDVICAGYRDGPPAPTGDVSAILTTTSGEA
jgi:ComF family protein